MKQILLSILLILLSLLGCQSLDPVDTVTVRPTEITIGPTTAETESTVTDTEPTENGPIVESLPQETLPPETQPVPTQTVTEPMETEPTETEPPETQPPETQPAETEPASTEPTETEPQQTEATEPVETEPPSTTSTEPTGCVHEWRSIYHPEEGHWVAGVACDCGWQVYGDPAQLFSQWNTHSASYPAAESLLYHGGYGSIDEWIVEIPAYDEWVCRYCGLPKP